MMFGFGWMGWWWPLMTVVFWIAVVVLGIWAARSLFPTSTTREGRESNALETLKRRYASGEITTEEFEEAHRVLER